jgi:hypothetical protein
VIRKLVIVAAMATTLIATCLRAARLPNNFATEHWLIDYRFGFVKRGLVGSLVSLAAGALGTRPSEGAIDAMAIVLFLAFCAAIMWVCIRLLRRGRWSSDLALAALVFLSSPFIVMSAHLVGYYDNLVVMLAIVSLALVFERRIWAAAMVQGVSLLVHENTLLIAFPAVVWAAFLDARSSPRAVRRMLPLLVPIVMFALLAIRQGTAPHHLESSLTHYLATYPFVAGTLADVRVPHWITIGFYESYRLHHGHLQERLLSQTMIALVFPSLLALVGTLVAAGVAAVSADVAIVLVICLLPQAMHVMVWDTSRTWTYSIVCAFLLLWIDVEHRRTRPRSSQVALFVSLGALVMNAIAATPLMDGLKEHFEVTARLWIYAPVFGVALGLARRSPRTTDEPDSLVT